MDTNEIRTNHYDTCIAEAADRCPACANYIDYCQGHGVIGDPIGHSVLVAHDDGDHTNCIDAADDMLQLWSAELPAITCGMPGVGGHPDEHCDRPSLHSGDNHTNENYENYLKGLRDTERNLCDSHDAIGCPLCGTVM